MSSNIVIELLSINILILLGLFAFGLVINHKQNINNIKLKAIVSQLAKLNEQNVNTTNALIRSEKIISRAQGFQIGKEQGVLDERKRASDFTPLA